MIFPQEPAWCRWCEDEAVGDRDQCCTGWCDVAPQGVAPTPAKIIRLAFHDCFK